MPRSKTADASPKTSARPKTPSPRVTRGLVLRPTEEEGVYLNAEGARVDERGVLVSIARVRKLKEMEEELAEELDLGPEVTPETSPAQLLRMIALDPRLPLSTRMSAAVSAAPYFDRKLPLALEGGDPNRPIKHDTSVALKHLDSLSTEERKLLLTLLEKMGAIPE